MSKEVKSSAEPKSACCGAPVWECGGNLNKVLEIHEYRCEKCGKPCPLQSPQEKPDALSFDITKVGQLDTSGWFDDKKNTPCLDPATCGDFCEGDCCKPNKKLDAVQSPPEKCGAGNGMPTIFIKKDAKDWKMSEKCGCEGEGGRVAQIRRRCTMPMNAFNNLNDFGKAYAYGSDCLFLLSRLCSLQAQVKVLREEHGKMKEALVKIGANNYQEVAKRYPCKDCDAASFHAKRIISSLTL